MKKIIIASVTALAIMLSAFTPASAAPRAKTRATVSAKLKKACPTIIDVTSGGMIYKNSAPIRSGGVGTPLIGFREEPTLILVKNLSTRSGTTIYDKAGNSIGRCPWATAHDTKGGRMRCVMKTRALRRTAVKNTKSPEIYFTIGNKRCVKVPDSGKCYGSVKGKCTQTLT